MIEILFIILVIAAPLIFLSKSVNLKIIVPVLYALAHLALTLMLLLQPYLIENMSLLPAYFRADELSLVYLCALSVLFYGVALYNIVYMKHQSTERTNLSVYVLCLLVFVFSMTGVILSAHLGLMWVFVEATTLATAYLIYFNRTKTSLEAAWKYLFICSIGIALAFVGILFLSIASGDLNSLFFKDLLSHAANLKIHWLKLAFVFMLIGFGTKVGLAPVHAWLPDAHSESPSPISALLSGALLNAALLAIFRIFMLMSSADLYIFARNILLMMGFLSIFIGAVYIVRVNNYKRMLAYSSIENMGIIIIGLALLGNALYAAMLHLVAHTLIKGAFFLTSGNILRRYETKDINKVSGLLQKDGWTAWLWIFSFVMMAGIPPSPIFFSEFIIFRTLLIRELPILAFLFLILLTIIMFGMARSVLKMAFGDAAEHIPSGRYSIFHYVSQTVFLILAVAAGFYFGRLFSIILQTTGG